MVRRLSAAATLPVRATADAAGFDLASAVACRVPARGRALVATDLAVALPDGVYGRVAPRSGLTVKHGLDVGAGVIDRDYRGSVGVALFNHSDEDYHIKPGDRIAQLILERVATIDRVTEVDRLPETKRGTAGFGSTGVNLTTPPQPQPRHQPQSLPPSSSQGASNPPPAANGTQSA